MIEQKRGASVLIFFRGAELLLFGLAIVFLFLIILHLNQTTYEKSFIARDIALLINTIYASPGDLEYTYDMKGYGFDLEIKNGYVHVFDPGHKGPQSYWFAEREDVEIDDFEAQGPSFVKFVKKGDRIEMEALYLR